MRCHAAAEWLDKRLAAVSKTVLICHVSQSSDRTQPCLGELGSSGAEGSGRWQLLSDDVAVGQSDCPAPLCGNRSPDFPVELFNIDARRRVGRNIGDIGDESADEHGTT
jgi:hypothetical protein